MDTRPGRDGRLGRGARLRDLSEVHLRHGEVPISDPARHAPRRIRELERPLRVLLRLLEIPAIPCDTAQVVPLCGPQLAKLGLRRGKVARGESVIPADLVTLALGQAIRGRHRPFRRVQPRSPAVVVQMKHRQPPPRHRELRVQCRRFFHQPDGPSAVTPSPLKVNRLRPFPQRWKRRRCDHGERLGRTHAAQGLARARTHVV